MIRFKCFVLLLAAWSSMCIPPSELMKQTGNANSAFLLQMVNKSQGPWRRVRSAPDIPKGYDHFPHTGLRNYYRLHETPVTWYEAKGICERESAHLAIINSETERQLLVDFFKKDRNNRGQLWLGFHDLYKEGEYVTIFGDPLITTGYTTWSPGKPDNFGEEDCGAMYSQGELNDMRCHYRFTFVCEYPVF